MFDWFWEFLYGLLKTVLYCIDFIMSFANKLVGIEPVYDANNKEIDIMNFFFTSDQVMSAFVMVAMVGIVLLFLFTAFAVIRSVARLGEGKTPLGVCANAAKSILYFLMIPAIMIVGSLFVSAVMTAIYRATLGGGTSLGSAMFTLFADEAYNGGGNKEQILDEFRRAGPFVEGASDNFNYYKTGQVDDYFSLSKINYFLGFVVGVAVLIMTVLPMLSFIERIISLVLLFIVSPISVASSVLDDGARFKLWRDQVINKFLIAYGSLLSLNIFILLVGVIYDVTFFKNNSFLNGMARILFVLGGAFACRMGRILIGNLVNQGAGSQYAQDAHNMSGYMHRVAAPIHGAAMGAVGRVAGLGAAAGKTALGGIKAAVTRRGSNSLPNVGGIGKAAGGGSQQFTAKLNPTGGTRARSNAVGERVGAARGKDANPFADKKPGGAGGGGQRTIQDVLLGPKAGGDNSMNKEGASTLKSAMKSGGIKP